MEFLISRTSISLTFSMLSNLSQTSSKSSYTFCSYFIISAFYRINIFPEAYASLIGLTSRGKLSEGMSLNADIGGGTTDISFFIDYKYWNALKS